MLDEGDKALIEKIAFRAAEHTAQKVTENFKLQLQLHQSECPVGKRFVEVENKAKGGWQVLAAIGGVVSGVAALVISWFK